MSTTSPDEIVIELPEREYGYRETPLMWDELKDIILVEKNLAKLSRSVPQQTEYELYMRQIKKEWKSVYDFILCSKFGYERRRRCSAEDDDDDQQQRWEAIHPTSKQMKKILVLNDFPYYNAPGIFHYVLWKIGADITPEEIDEAKQQLRDELGDVADILHWINPPHLKSLPDIDHVHILCHRRRNNKNEIL